MLSHLGFGFLGSSKSNFSSSYFSAGAKSVTRYLLAKSAGLRATVSEHESAQSLQDLQVGQPIVSAHRGAGGQSGHWNSLVRSRIKRLLMAFSVQVLSRVKYKQQMMNELNYH